MVSLPLVIPASRCFEQFHHACTHTPNFGASQHQGKETDGLTPLSRRTRISKSPPISIKCLRKFSIKAVFMQTTQVLGQQSKCLHTEARSCLPVCHVVCASSGSHFVHVHLLEVRCSLSAEIEMLPLACAVSASTIVTVSHSTTIVTASKRFDLEYLIA